jgi:hypothetical protein
LIKRILKALLEQSWTLLGMFVAWVVLEGSARIVVSYAIVFTIIVWVLYSLTQDKEDKE